MILLIDIGNTRVKWALLNGRELQGYGQCQHADMASEFERIAEVQPEAVYWVSVAAQTIEQDVMRYVEKRWSLTVKVLETGKACCGVTNGYEHPQQLGVDRWAAMIAARQLFRTPLCVVDCGSAVTIDVLAEQGEHLGGYIIPGLRMQQSLLRQGTAAVNISDTGVEQRGWGRNTGSCVARGSVEAIAGLIERSCRQLRQQLNEEVKIVVTGGDAVGILPLLEPQAHHEEHLVLLGMAYMVRELEG